MTAGPLHGSGAARVGRGQRTGARATRLKVNPRFKRKKITKTLPRVVSAYSPTASGGACVLRAESHDPRSVLERAAGARGPGRRRRPNIVDRAFTWCPRDDRGRGPARRLDPASPRSAGRARRTVTGATARRAEPPTNERELPAHRPHDCKKADHLQRSPA